MPYIKAVKRPALDRVIDPLIAELATTSVDDRDGSMNYVVTRLLHALYPTNYFNLNRAVGVVECVKLELYRRIAAPYEDKKIVENGDV